MKEFTQDVLLDATLVLAGMRYGISGITQYAFTRRDIFETPGDAIDRCTWIKTQGEEYINLVSDKVIELENMQS